MSSVNIGEELERLEGLRDRGVLTEEQFQKQKDVLLGGPQTTVADTKEKPKTKPGQAALGCVIIVGVLIAIGAIFGGGSGGGGSGSAPAEKAAETPAKAVTAMELWRAYQANEARAQADYGNQPLLVTGTVAGIDLNIVDNPVVQLATGNEFMSAQASLADASKPKAKDLDKGQAVTLRCQSVSEVASTPMLSDCELQ